VPKRLIGQTDKTGRLKRGRPKKGFGGLFREEKAGELSRERQALVDIWAKDKWAFLTATDPTTEGNPPVILTVDEHDKIDPFKPFPKHWAHIPFILDQFYGPIPYVITDKCRQVMATWAACVGGLLHDILFLRGQNHFISKSTEGEAEILVEEKIRGPILRAPKWFQEWAMITEEPKGVVTCLRTGSKINAVACNAGERKFRGSTPSIVLIDEAARQDALSSMLQATYANAGRIWLITTPEFGSPGAAECKAILNDGEASRYMAEERVAEDDSEPLQVTGWDQR
jgi:hypothetical protein